MTSGVGAMTSASPRLVSPEKRGEDTDVSLRPQVLADFIGQEAARRNLKVFIESARSRGEAFMHAHAASPYSERMQRELTAIEQ